MYVRHRHLLTLAAACIALLSSSPAWAWVETSLESHVVVLDIERDGRATVSHELIVKVRGGPLMGLELPGIDADAEPLPDASVAPVRSDAAAGSAIPLLLERREDRTLRIDIDHPKGIRRGKFLFRFRYRTELVERELVRHAGSLVEVRWVGPRLPGGIDSARVVFRLPPAPTAPRLPESSDRAALGLEDEPAGVFLSTLRRAADKDELEVVRPHVAAGEPVVWRVLASAKTFDAFAPAETVAAFEPPPMDLPAPPEQRALRIALFVAIALLYAALVLAKWRAVSRAARSRGARARRLLPLPATLAAALSGAFLAGAAALGALTRHPTLAGIALLLSMLLAAHASPAPELAPRGPGRWLPLTEAEAFGGRPATLPGRWLDAGSLPGFFVFAVLLSGFAVAAIQLLPRSPYHALSAAIASACLLPIFCTGRGNELPLDPVHGPQKLLSWLSARLADDARLRAVPWARLPEGAAEPDELRLLVALRQPVKGLVALEAGIESQPGLGGPIAAPWVIVRALDGSPAHRALECVAWTRGRKPEERVAVLRPKLPTRALCLALVTELADTLTERAPAARQTRQPPIRSRISAGRGASTAKAGSASSPAHAT